MRPSAEAGHVFGEKKERRTSTIAKRVGRSVFQDPGNLGDSKYGRLDRAKARDERVKRQEAAAHSKLQKLVGEEEISKALEQANGSRVHLVADTPSATVEALIAREVADLKVDQLMGCELTVTTKGENPKTSIFDLQEREKRGKYYGTDGLEALLDRLDPKTGLPIYYHTEAEEIQLANTVGRCFDALSQSAEDGSLEVTVEAPQPEAVTA